MPPSHTSDRDVAPQVIGDVLLGVRRLIQRPGYRARFFSAFEPGTLPGALRAVRAVQSAPQSEPSLNDVGKLLGVDASTASRLVEQGVRAGYITHETSTIDQRRSVLALTSEGQDLLGLADAARQTVLSELTSAWPNDEVAALAHLLKRLVAGLDEFDQG